MVSPVCAPPAVGCCLMLPVVFHGDCDWPLPLDPAFGSTYQTALEMLKVMVAVRDTLCAVPVYVYVSVPEFCPSGGVYVNLPLASSVIEPPAVVAAFVTA